MSVCADMVKIYIDQKVAELRDLHREIISSEYSDFTIYARLAAQASNVLDGHRAGNSAVTFHLGSWSPDLKGSGSNDVMACDLTLEQAREAIAREYGYTNWREVDELRSTLLDEEFEMAVDAVLEGDVLAIESRLLANPNLVNQRSQYAHSASLLHYIGANGVESYRQVTPMNAVEVAQCLIKAGADVNASANMYGGSTALNLVLTSAHPHNAGVAEDIAKVLKEAGAVY